MEVRKRLPWTSTTHSLLLSVLYPTACAFAVANASPMVTATTTFTTAITTTPLTTTTQRKTCVAGTYVQAVATASADRTCAPCEALTFQAGTNQDTCNDKKFCGVNEYVE